VSADAEATGAFRDARSAAGPHVDVRRSRRRRRTVSAYRDGDRTVVLIPARFSRAEEDEWVATMLDRLSRQDRRRRPSDDALARRATELSARYLGGCARPRSVSWVDNQSSRWGSCTPADASIRISSRVRGMPSWVLDYVLLHELAHLLEPRHGPAFWALLESYPRTERARGYLEGVSAAGGLDLGNDVADARGNEPDDQEDDEQEDEPDDGLDEATGSGPGRSARPGADPGSARAHSGSAGALPPARPGAHLARPGR
jgi:predicted metal-dependent hydrolase